MWGGISSGLCLLALLFVGNYAEEAVSSEDLKADSPHLPEEDSKSAALAQSSAYSDADSSQLDDLSDPLEASKSSASAGAYSSNGGQASAQANAQSSQRDSNLLRPGLSSPGFGSSAQAGAKAQAKGGVGLNGFKKSLYQPYDLNPYGSGSSAQAQAEAQAIGSGLGGNGLGPGSYGPGNSYSLSAGPGSSSAQAKAEAQALANSAGSPGGPALYQGLNYLRSPGLSSAQAQAEAQALSNGGGYSPVPNVYQPGYQPQYQPLYQGGQSNALAQAQAQAELMSELSGNLQGPGHSGYSPLLPSSGGSSAKALADAQAVLGGSASANAQAIANADAYSRVIPRHEYITPNLIPGAKDVIVCTVEGELHYVWTSAYQCLVCTCIRELGQLLPVCARCDGCMSPDPSPPVPQPVPPHPVPGPEPLPIIIPVTAPPVVPKPSPVPPAPQVSCSPLPSGQPFQNPLNPCQICVCREIISLLGEPDVQIDCQQNPECVIPVDVTTLPPDIPVPVPLPVCDKFPPNVIFPHPTDVCKVCKCIAESIGLGLVESKIVCMTLPECLPRPLPPVPTPAPEPITLPPLPPPVPIPIPPEPIPWPPATTPLPIPVSTPGPIPAPQPAPIPGPLPGPSPHESCRPYPPNQPFQHPWDECQVCVCTEAYAYGLITIEVNCFTKKACCYEPPEPVTLSPGPYIPTPPIVTPPSIQILDKICEYKSLGVEFLSPTDMCLVCVCELQGNLVTSACRRSQTPECLGVYYPGGSGGSAETQASAIAQSGSVPLPYSTHLTNGPSGGQSIASAEANAIAQSSLQPGLQPGLQPWSQPGYQQLQPHLQPEIQPSLQPVLPSILQPGYQQLQPILQPELQPSSQPILPSILQPGYQQLQHILQPELQPSLQPVLPSVLQPNVPGQYYPVPSWDVMQPGGSQSSALAEAQAISQGQSQAQAHAQAQSQNQANKPIHASPYFPSSGLQENDLTPYWAGNPNPLANNDALTNALHGYSQSSPYSGNHGGNSLGNQYQLPYFIGNQGLGNQVGGGYNLPLAGLGYGQPGGAGIRGSGSSAMAEAEALANALSGNNYGSPYYGGDLGQGSAASAEAKANAQTSLVGGGSGNSYSGGSPYSPYQSPYFKQGYQPSSASAQAQAQASALGGSSAQSQALASASTGKKLGKSAQEDMELLDSGSME